MVWLACELAGADVATMKSGQSILLAGLSLGSVKAPGNQKLRDCRLTV
jgi:hypothetical protein